MSKYSHIQSEIPSICWSLDCPNFPIQRVFDLHVFICCPANGAAYQWHASCTDRSVVKTCMSACASTAVACRAYRSGRGRYLPLPDHRNTSLISWHCHSMTVAGRMSARASTVAARPAYRANKKNCLGRICFDPEPQAVL